jgi:His/Glu/Gln/Arg/opine family amino acid ABC transporter permease subunit
MNLYIAITIAYVTLNFAVMYAMRLLERKIRVREQAMLDLDPELLAQTAPILLKGMSITLQITAAAVVFGMLLGTLLAVARVSPIRSLRWIATFYVNYFRSIPLVMVLMWFYLIVPQMLARFFNISPLTDIRLISAITAFTMFEAAYYAEIIWAGLNSISRGQAQAALALGDTAASSAPCSAAPGFSRYGASAADPGHNPFSGHGACVYSRAWRFFPYRGQYRQDKRL